MKKTLLLSIFIGLSVVSAFAQTDTSSAKKHVKRDRLAFLTGNGVYNRDSTWHFGAFLGLTVSQTALYQWSPGGTNSFSLLGAASAYANYKKKNIEWCTNLDMKYGMGATGLLRNGQAKTTLQKNIDVLQLSTNVGYQIKKELYASLKASFLSQFSPTYDPSQVDTTNGRFRKFVVSKFAAPAIITLGAGLTYKPKEWFTLFFSPIEGKITYVSPPGKDTTGQYLGAAYLPNQYFSGIDPTRFGLTAGTTVMAQLGAELDILFQKDIIKNVNWKSHLNVFESYANNNYNTIMPNYYATQDSMGTKLISKKTQFIPTVTWDNDIVFKINKILSATLSTRFIYQYNAITPVDKYNNSTHAKGADGLTDVDKNGVTITTYNKLQIFEQFGIGLAMKF